MYKEISFWVWLVSKRASTATILSFKSSPRTGNLAWNLDYMICFVKVIFDEVS